MTKLNRKDRLIIEHDKVENDTQYGINNQSNIGGTYLYPHHFSTNTQLFICRVAHK